MSHFVHVLKAKKSTIIVKYTHFVSSRAHLKMPFRNRSDLPRSVNEAWGLMSQLKHLCGFIVLLRDVVISNVYEVHFYFILLLLHAEDLQGRSDKRQSFMTFHKKHFTGYWGIGCKHRVFPLTFSFVPQLSSYLVSMWTKNLGRNEHYGMEKNCQFE